jgi:hypothetical protein
LLDKIAEWTNMNRPKFPAIYNKSSFAIITRENSAK